MCVLLRLKDVYDSCRLSIGSRAWWRELNMDAAILPMNSLALAAFAICCEPGSFAHDAKSHRSSSEPNIPIAGPETRIPHLGKREIR